MNGVRGAVVAAGVMCGLSGLARAADPVDVKAVLVGETRSADLPALDKKMRELLDKAAVPFDSLGGLTVRLQLTGKPIEGAFAMGKVKLIAGKLDKNRPLKPLKSKIQSSAFDVLGPVGRPLRLEGFPDPPKGEGQAYLQLMFESPPRDAATIVALEGTIMLVGGKRENLKFPIAKASGKLSDKTLTAAGLTVTVVKPPEAAGVEPEQAVTFEIDGDLDKVLEVVLVDAKGENLHAAFQQFAMPDKKKIFVLDLGEKIPADAALALEVVPQPESQDIPFKLSNIKLP